MEFFERLGQRMWLNGIQTPANRFIELFHAHVDPVSLESVPNKLRDPNSPLRCVVSTIALGMGIQVPNIDYVLHLGPPSSMLD